MLTNEYFLPKLKTIKINNYSLYNNSFEIDFSKKLQVFFGTNGTGKTTLLYIIIYSIIGPYRQSVKTGYYMDKRKDSRSMFSPTYLRDRMSIPLDNATVEATFEIGKDEYIVLHSLYENKLLRVILNGCEIGGKQIQYRTYENEYFKADNDQKKLSEYLVYKYHDELGKSTKLPEGINTLISMFMDVIFFSEQRNYTFWSANLQNLITSKYIVGAEFFEEYFEQTLITKSAESAYKKASETANYLTKFLKKNEYFGLNKKNEYVNEMDVLQLEKEIELLERQLDNVENDIAQKNEEFKRSKELLRNFQREMESKLIELDKVDKEWYDLFFPNPYNEYYKQFENSINQHKCPICSQGYEYDHNPQNCVLCKQKLNLKSVPDERLIQLDKTKKSINNQIKELIAEIDEAKKQLMRIENNKNNDTESYRQLKHKLDDLKLKSKDSKRKSEDSDFGKMINKALLDRENAYASYRVEQEKEKKMLKSLNNQLVESFPALSKNFSVFADSFFGKERKAKIQLPEIDDSNILNETMIKFSLNDVIRDDYIELSESQRIFTDLSFRFSILTTFHSSSFFICETPDSSLDKFYEQNAVKTFEEYIKRGNNLILTANAKNSPLIKDLCRKSNATSDLELIDLTKLSTVFGLKEIDVNEFIFGGE